MIKNIKDGLSHVRKDKIKIQYEIEFKKLTNLSDDLIDKFISIKWERGKNEKGETKDIRVISGQIEKLHASSNLTHSVSLSEIPTTSTTVGNHRIGYNTIGGGGSNHHGITSSATPYIELEKIPKSLSRKQSKLLLGNKIDGSNHMNSGDAIAIIPNEKIIFKVHLFSNTIHRKQDHTLQTNYEQKLLNLFIYSNNNTLSHTQIDLSLHAEENLSNNIAIPFPSSSKLQPTLFMSIKSTFLKYNDKPIIKASKEIIKKRDLGNILQPNGANTLMEYLGEVYFIQNNNNNNSNNNSNIVGGGNLKSENSNSVSGSGKESVNKVLRFELDSENMENTNDVNNKENNNSDNENVNNNNNNNNNSGSEKNSSQSAGTTWDDLTEEDHFKNNVSEVTHNKIVCQKNEEIKVLNERIKKLQDDVADQKRLRGSLQTLVEDCRIKVLEYEEGFHRAQHLENYAKKQLIIERLEFQKKVEKLSNQIKSLQQQQSQQQQQQQSQLNNSITTLISTNGSNVIKDVILGTNINDNQHKDDSSNHSPTIGRNNQISSPDSGSRQQQQQQQQQQLIKEQKEKEEKDKAMIDSLLLELEQKNQTIKEMSSKSDTAQLAYEIDKKKLQSENNEIKDQLEVSNNKLIQLRTNIDKLTKEQVQIELKNENELRKKIKNGAFNVNTSNGTSNSLSDKIHSTFKNSPLLTYSSIIVLIIVIMINVL